METTTVNILAGAEPVLKRIYEQKFTAKETRRQKKNFQPIMDELKLYHETLEGLYQKYGEQKGTQIKLLPKYSKEFSEELQELLADSVDLKDYKLIKISLLESVKFEFSMQDMDVAEIFIDWEEPEPKEAPDISPAKKKEG